MCQRAAHMAENLQQTQKIRLPSLCFRKVFDNLAILTKFRHCYYFQIMSVLCIVINGQFVKSSKFKKITRTNFVKSQLFPTFALLNTVLQARMAESVDALVSNTNVRKDVPVRPRLRVPN